MTPRRRHLAWGLALLVDALQILALPANAAGPLAWFMDAGLDLLTMALMTALLGWHWAFLPSFAVELIPFVDVVPSWTLAAWIASRSRPAAGPASQGWPRRAGSSPDSQLSSLPDTETGQT